MAGMAASLAAGAEAAQAAAVGAAVAMAADPGAMAADSADPVAMAADPVAMAAAYSGRLRVRQPVAPMQLGVAPWQRSCREVAAWSEPDLVLEPVAVLD
jgi:CTP:molybdopterin cytidylyltransferase MocA